MTAWQSYRLTRVDPGLLTVVITAIAYAAVAGTFSGHLDIYPSLSRSTIDLLSHAIAVVNTGAVIAIAIGWYWIRDGQVRRHIAAMVTAILLILAFLVMYLTRIGGGGQKEIVGAEGIVLTTYLGMLAIHILLSILAVPLVVYVVALAVTRPIDGVYDTNHAKLGRLAAATWLISLILGIVTYIVLNHVYEAQLA